MVQYEITKADKNLYKRDFCRYYSKKAFIISACFIPYTVFLLFVGYFSDAQALMYAYGFLSVSLFAFAFGCTAVLKVNRQFSNMFNECDEMHYCVELKDRVCTVKNITQENQIWFDCANVKRISKLKHIIIVKLKNNKIIFFPKTKDTENFFTIWDYGVL